MQTKQYNLPSNAYLTSYVYDDYRVDMRPEAKPAIIICPGGGWMYLSEREGEPIAMEFAKRGYHAFVLHYSVSQAAAATGDFRLIHQALEDTEGAYGILLELAGQQMVDAGAISILGFSAGGQLAALFGAKHPELQACILCYPMLDLADEVEFATSEDCPQEHQDIMKSCFSVMGIDGCEAGTWSEINPVERVTSAMPPTFLWHGTMDDLVRVTGSLNFARKLVMCKVPCEVHIYDHCGHGISLGTKETAAVEKEINEYGAVWFAQLLRWMEELGNEKE